MPPQHAAACGSSTPSAAGPASSRSRNSRGLDCNCAMFSRACSGWRSQHCGITPAHDVKIEQIPVDRSQDTGSGSAGQLFNCVRQAVALSRTSRLQKLVFEAARDGSAYERRRDVRAIESMKAEGTQMVIPERTRKEIP